MAEDNNALLREMHTGIALLTQEQSDFNKRLGIIESTLKTEDELEKEAEKTKQAKRSEWWTWGLQTVGQVILVAAISWVLSQAGVEYTSY